MNVQGRRFFGRSSFPCCCCASGRVLPYAGALFRAAAFDIFVVLRPIVNVIGADFRAAGALVRRKVAHRLPTVLRAVCFVRIILVWCGRYIGAIWGISLRVS